LTNKETKRLVAIASSGGHWEQLMMLSPGFRDLQVTYMTTMAGLTAQGSDTNTILVTDCHQRNFLKISICVSEILWHLILLRPAFVVSTGALPGVLGLVVGKFIGAKTIWIDSVANADEMSKSGRFARRFSDVWLSQWKHVAEKEGADFRGTIL
jgi:UDP-N-acetylglucosamine:LPS N-acetylglucosamine transferase